MYIKNLLGADRPSISFEVFPPKADADISTIFTTIDELSTLSPDFISVTYGAGGSTSKRTVELSRYIQSKNIPALAHLTCVSATTEEIAHTLDELAESDITNVLALRGDIPQDSDFPCPGHFSHASDLVTTISKRGGFCVGGACYPEGHVECADQKADLMHLKQKVEAGCDFLITQLFFDDDCFHSFMEKLYYLDIKVPVIAGIMPITAKSQIKRMCDLSGAAVPGKLRRILTRYEDDPVSLKEAGIMYATEQIIDLLASGVDGIHIYTMNKSEICSKILDNIRHIRNAEHK
ncbi:MAG: methylenetetrahydrofolate reductase [NAD(P)H] [Ruminococcaceae bacterium]|nr:methylenetetrahydrofolate reductase [NAD(P)H] [Oscillospiraceae bacterium]